MNTPIEKAIGAVANQQALADAVGVTTQAVSRWRKRRIPAERVLDVERATGVSRHVLRPDLYPVEA